MAEQRESQLTAIMDTAARERLARIAIVKPDKARALENHFLGLAQKGQLGGKVKESSLVAILEKLEGQSGVKKITIKRTGGFSDSDSDNDDDLL